MTGDNASEGPNARASAMPVIPVPIRKNRLSALPGCSYVLFLFLFVKKQTAKVGVRPTEKFLQL
jgi:hypothetical protein